jgi:hypothetical protein
MHPLTTNDVQYHHCDRYEATYLEGQCVQQHKYQP